MRTEDERVGRLLNAQANAVALFDEVVARGIIAPGQGEQVLSYRVRDLANEMFGKTPVLPQSASFGPARCGVKCRSERVT